MNKVLPTNSILFIKVEVEGINLFMARPAKKAPIIGSAPMISAKNDEANRTVNVNKYCKLPSVVIVLKNHLLNFGRKKNIIKLKTPKENKKINIKLLFDPSFNKAVTKASIKRTKVSAITVPLMAILTANDLAIPSFVVVGKAIKVWEANNAPIKTEGRISRANKY